MVARTQSLRAAAYEEVMLTEAGRFLEVHEGLLREKPTEMSAGHNITISRLNRQLVPQLDPVRFDVRINTGRVRRGDEAWYIPDVYVVAYQSPPSLRDVLDRFEAFDDPLPLVAEIWFPSTGSYDIAKKLPVYMQRGDHEIMFVHPIELTLTSWRRRPDGGYDEAVHRAGRIELHALPGVVLDLDALFA